MKKILLTIAAAVSMCHVSYGQYFTFASTTGIYDDFTTPGTPILTGDMYVGFIWMAGAGQTLPGLGSATTAGETTCWSALGSLPVGLSGGSSWSWFSSTELAHTESTPPPALGTYSRNDLISLGGMGMATGDVISLYVVAWDAADGTTVSAASAADAPVGWSGEIDVTLGSSFAPAGQLGPAGGGFDVDQVPEPATLALTALGGVSMVFLRRRTVRTETN